MEKSRLAIAAVLATGLFQGPAAAQAPRTAEQAVEHQREQLQGSIGIACPRDAAPDDIIVCGRRGPDPHRIPINERAPGDRVAMLPGELPSARGALSAGQSSCSTVGPNQRCSGGLNVFQVVSVLAKIGKHLLDPED